jgi:hypothetical protein
MSKEQRRYISYLLRLWETEDNQEFVWRVSLESPHSGERMGFSSLADLCAFLEREMRNTEKHETLAPDGSTS